MSQFSATSALERATQFLVGFAIDDREGRKKAPASGTYVDGTLVKVSSDGLSFEVCGNNDATYILEQPVGTGPIASAANREKYLAGIPQNVCANGAEITAYALGGQQVIRTSNVATGTATGAITASTAVGTEVEAYSGVWRELQPGNTAIGIITRAMDDDSMVEITIY